MPDSNHIIIAGAGLAGLTAAYDLQQQGFTTTILEASDSIGGRVKTIRQPFDNGLYAEAGAMAITSADTALLGLLKKLDLNLISLKQRIDNARYRAANQWHDINEPCSARILPDNLKQCSVSGLLRHYIDAARLEHLKPDTNCFNLNDELLALDELSLADFLRREGASECEIYLIANFSSAALLGDGIEHLSALQYLMRCGHKRDVDNFFAVENGNDNIITCLLQQLDSAPLTETPLIKVTQTKDGICAQAKTAEGEIIEIEGAALLCTLPLPVLKQVEFTPELNSDKSAVIAELADSYTSVSRVYFQCSPAHRQQGLKSAQSVIDRPSMIIEDHTNHLSDISMDVLEIHTIGDPARAVANMTLDEQVEKGSLILEEILPGITADKKTGIAVCWDKQPFHHGAYLSFRPGGMKHLPVLARPENNIYFAGEHVSMLPGSLEGAVRSANEAVSRLIADITS
ncbi:flavin monoamine oxidase family protein [Spongorhabdus nitratireducens]